MRRRVDDPMEYLEQLASEWYEYQGYLVRRNLWVGLEADGSYECELNVVAFHPTHRHVVQIEPILDFLSWKERERHFRTKFEAGKKYLHRTFGEPSIRIEQIALIVSSDDPHRRTVAGGKIVLLSDLLGEILKKLCCFSISAYMLPEQWPLLRTLQFVAEYREQLTNILVREREAAS
jgi:hypothetical protein